MIDDQFLYCDLCGARGNQRYERDVVRKANRVYCLNCNLRLIGRARKLSAEFKQIFIDAAYWNDHVRTPFEKPIDPDPDGKLAVCLQALDGSLAAFEAAFEAQLRDVLAAFEAQLRA